MTDRIVAQDGSGGYSTINAAVSAAQAGDTVRIKTGVYYERVLMNSGRSGITVEPYSDSDYVIVDAGNEALATGNCFRIAGMPSFTIRNIHCRNAKKTALSIATTSTGKVIGCYITTSGSIYCDATGAVDIIGCIVDDMYLWVQPTPQGTDGTARHAIYSAGVNSFVAFNVLRNTLRNGLRCRGNRAQARSNICRDIGDACYGSSAQDTGQLDALRNTLNKFTGPGTDADFDPGVCIAADDNNSGAAIYVLSDYRCQRNICMADSPDYHFRFVETSQQQGMDGLTTDLILTMNHRRGTGLTSGV